ncbi:MAG: glycosyltransferase [Reichenbachiella sp.]
MKVLILCTSLYGGGAEKIVSLISQKLVPSPLIGIFNKKPKQHPYGGHIINLKFGPANNFLFKIVNSIKRIYIVKKLKERYKPDIVISFMQGPNLLNVLTKKKERVIISIRNNDVDKYTKASGAFLYFEHLLLKYLSNRADSIISVSKALVPLISKEYGIKDKSKIRAIQNGCDIQYIKAQMSKELPASYLPIFEGPTIMTVGKLETQKGHMDLLKIFYHVRKQCSNSKLIILGQGSLKNNLIGYAESLGLNVCTSMESQMEAKSDVYFLGFQANPYAFMSRADLFVLSSLYEGFPNVLLEAMACDLPIVSSDCPTGPREILTEGNNLFGKLLPMINNSSLNTNLSTDEVEWVNTISSILTEKGINSKLRELSRERVSSFDLDFLTSKWEELINAEQ